MQIKPEKGYEVLWNLKLLSDGTPEGDEAAARTKKLMDQLETFSPTEDLEVIDRWIPGAADGQKLQVRIYRLKNAGITPLLIDIHGGGFVVGTLDKDNNRCARYAKGVPCTVMQIDYRLATESPFPAQIEDCFAGLCWAYQNAEELRIDRTKIALHGSSAGGSLCAGLALYSRDHDGPKICFEILNYPALGMGDPTISQLHLFDDAPIVSGVTAGKANRRYLGGYDGTMPSYYAVPLLCLDLSDMPATAIVASEYCPLRDDGIRFAQRLMRNGIPTELYVLPRVPHAYDLIDQPRTRWIVEGLCLSLRREFEMQ